jgi:hypothetical protein
MRMKITREEAYKIFEEAIKEKDKEKLKEFILFCLYKNVDDEKLFKTLMMITKIDIEEV